MDCKGCSAEWLPRDQHIDWKKYLAQYYEASSKFMHIDDEGPLLMRSRWFSFGFSQVDDVKQSGESVLVQHFPNEIRCRLSFDRSAVWKSYREEQTKMARVKTFDTFIAYPTQLKLENKRIQDLKMQKQWLPLKYRDLDIYNLEEHENDGRESESEQES